MFSHFKYSLGANLGVKNGSIVAFDVGYWLGLSEGLEKIINANPLPLTEKKLELLKRNCESIKKATQNINLDPTDESINDKLKLIKDGVYIKYVLLVTLARFRLFTKKYQDSFFGFEDNNSGLWGRNLKILESFGTSMFIQRNTHFPINLKKDYKNFHKIAIAKTGISANCVISSF